MFTKYARVAGLAAIMALPASAGLTQEGDGLSQLGEATEWEIGEDHTQILISWDHIGVTTTYAVIREFEGTAFVDPESPEDSHVSITMDMTSFDSFLEMRDEIFKSDRFMNVEEYPEATFESTSIEVTGETSADIIGELTYRGRTVPVTLNTEFNKVAENMGETVVGFHASTTLDRAELGMEDLYPRVGPEISLNIVTELVPMHEEESSEG